MPNTTTPVTTQPATLPPTVILNGSVYVNMSLEETEPDTTTGVLRYGKRAKFRCRAYLADPFNDSNELDGLSLVFNDAKGRSYEDGCLSSSVLSADKTFFTDAVKRCPVFSPTSQVYTIEISFTVSQQFVGMLGYRCMFRTQYWSYLYRGWYPSTGGTSTVVNLNGVAEPTINLYPKQVSGFVNEIKDIWCTSNDGYPAGNVTLNYEDGGEVAQTVLRRIGNVQNITAQIELTKNDQGKRVVCSNSAHKRQNMRSEVISVFYLNLLNNGTVKMEEIGENINVDCASNVETNGNAKYRWTGSIVPYSQINRPKVDLLYSLSRSGGLRRIDCAVTLQGDPLKREWKIRYLLYYIEARTPSEFSNNNNSGIAVVIVSILMVTLAIIGYAVGREITSRKINNRVVTRDLEKHHAKGSMYKAADPKPAEKTIPQKSIYSQIEITHRDVGTKITDDTSPRFSQQSYQSEAVTVF